MGIRFATVSEKLKEAINQDELDNALHARHGQMMERIRADHVVHYPHTIFHLNSKDLLKKSSLDSATAFGIRFLAKKDGIYYKMEFHDTEEDSYTHHAVREGGHATHLGEIISSLKKHLYFIVFPYELRILEVSGIYLTAIWLQPSWTWLPAYFIPVSPTPHYVKKGKRYRMDSFLALAQQAAKDTQEIGSGIHVEDEESNRGLLEEEPQFEEEPHIEQDEDYPALDSE